MSDTAPACRSDEPPPPPEIQQDVDLWNPGGDPGELRRAAQAWRAMADTVESAAGNLDGAVNRALSQWDGEASARFAKQWSDVHTGMTADVVPHLREIAGKLDETANSIEDINDQIHDLYVSIGVAVGVGAVLSVVTLGFSAAASAAAAAAAGARAGVLVARMASILQAVASALRAAKLTSHYVKAWGVAAGVNTTATGISKAITNPNHNPLDGWTWDDLSSVVHGSTAAGLTMGTSRGLIGSGMLGSAGRAAAAHPIWSGAAMGGLGNSGGSVLNELVGGEPVDWGDAGIAGGGGMAGGAAGAGLARGIAKLRVRPAASSPTSPLPPAQSPADRPFAPDGFTQRPSGLYVRDDALPAGWGRSPGGIIRPDAAPPGWHTSPSGLAVPGPPPPVPSVVAVSGWDELLGSLLGESPPVGAANSLTPQPRPSEPAPIGARAGC